MRRLPLLLTALVAVMAVCSLPGWARGRWAEEAARRKADYLYLEAQSRDVAGEHDAAYELLSESWRLNPDDKAVGYDLAVYMLQLMGSDTALFRRAGDMLRDFYEAHPDDYYGAITYGTLLEYQGRQREAVDVWESLHRDYPTNIQVMFKLASTLENVRDTAAVRRAIALYDTLGNIDGSSTELVLHKMQLLYRLGDTTAIMRDVDAMLSAPGGRNVENLVLAGNTHGALGHDEQAERLLKEACAVDSASGLASYALANFYRSIGDSIGYEREVFEALMRPALEVEVKNDLLLEYVVPHLRDSLMQPRIEELFAVLVDQYPHESVVHRSYAEYLAFNERYEEAAEQIGYSLDADPAKEDDWKMLARLLLVLEDYPKSIATSDEALRYFPGAEWIYYTKAFAYQQDGDTEAAMATMREWLELPEVDEAGNTLKTDEAMSRMYTFLGDMYFNASRPDEAFEAYRNALEYNPDNALTLNNYAYFLAVEGRNLDEAQRMVEKAMALEPDNTNTVDTYAWVMFKKKDYQRAREIFDSAIDDILAEDEDGAGPAPDLYEHAGDIYFMTGDHEEAVSFWEKALAEDPDNALLRRKVEERTYFFK